MPAEDDPRPLFSVDENDPRPLFLDVPNRRLAVLVSGRGSNLQAILDAIREGRLDATVALVLSNVAGAPALDRARAARVETLVIDHREFSSREAFDRVVAAEIRRRDVRLICLAGFMRLLSAEFVREFDRSILNIHPSLLPAFPGSHAQRQALEAGVKVAGCTVHFVTERVDAGPILLQACVPVLEDDTEESLSARILEQEHSLYPQAIALVLDGRCEVRGRRVAIR